MITLEFRGIEAASARTLGPAAGFRIAGNFMRQQPEDVVVARYARHQWELEGQHYSRYDCYRPARVHFEDARGARTEEFGPFDHLLVADGTMYADNELFAKFGDETLLWHSFVLENYWPDLVITSASK